ncbi:pro-cathepsin H-like [Ochlerotatus camptorhynchus]|uniref:pro-cathepsin H-like n=1 Tax=Ochlerotatus camptorhynchus TaxID=644619 RepID=UPI0031E3AEF7
MATRKFICKRGSLDEFFSDNGTNFKGARNEMSNAKQKISAECAESVSSPAIKWHFIPPGTPHMGGSWERMVRSVATKDADQMVDDEVELVEELRDVYKWSQYLVDKMYYANGVCYEPEYKNNLDGLNHAVVAVGYGILKGGDYWLIKNSWFNYWGNDGYALMAVKGNNCGLTTAATY